MSPKHATKNFLWSELECKCGCGTRFVSAAALQKLQALRDLVGPLRINSACRCPIHNARVGGAPLSQHRSTEQSPSTAFDIALGDYRKETLIAAAEKAGFRGFGVNYKTFLHLDDRARRARW